MPGFCGVIYRPMSSFSFSCGTQTVEASVSAKTLGISSIAETASRLPHNANMQLGDKQHAGLNSCLDLDVVSAGLATVLALVICTWAWHILATEVEHLTQHSL